MEAPWRPRRLKRTLPHGLLRVLLCWLGAALLLLGAAQKATGAQVVLRGTGTNAIATALEAFQVTYPLQQISRGAWITPIYTRSGSATGLNAISDASVYYSGSLVPLSGDQVAQGLKLVPLAATGLAFTFNFPGELAEVNLNISREAALAIYQGSLSLWNDSRILGRNPVLLPFSPSLGAIRLLAPNETGSGQTRTLTGTFSAWSNAWNASIGTISNAAQIPVFSQSSNILSSFDGLPALSIQNDWSLAFMDLAQAMAYRLPIASMENLAGEFVKPTVAALEISAGSFIDFPTSSDVSNPYVSLGGVTTSGAYPFAGTAYIGLRQGNPTDCRLAYEVVRYVYWMLTDPEALRLARAFYYGMQPNMSAVGVRVLDTLTCLGGSKILAQVQADLAGESTDLKNNMLEIALGTMGGILGLLLLGLGGYWFYLSRKRKGMLEKGQISVAQAPTEMVLKTQSELNGTVNYDPARQQGQVYQAQLIRPVGGEARAVVGPVPYESELWKPDKTRKITDDDIELVGVFTGVADGVAAGKIVEGGVAMVASPIVVEPRWQRSTTLASLWAAVLTFLDAVAIVLLWLAFFALPSTLNTLAPFAAFVTIASIVFVAQTVVTALSIATARETSVNLDAADMVAGKDSADLVAHIKSRARRLRIASVSEVVYRTSLVSFLFSLLIVPFCANKLPFLVQLLREVPLAILLILILIQNSITSSFVVLSLCAVCLSAGFKVCMIPQSLECWRSYADMKALYHLLKESRGKQVLANGVNGIHSPVPPAPASFASASSFDRPPDGGRDSALAYSDRDGGSSVNGAGSSRASPPPMAMGAVAGVALSATSSNSQRSKRSNPANLTIVAGESSVPGSRSSQASPGPNTPKATLTPRTPTAQQYSSLASITPASSSSASRPRSTSPLDVVEAYGQGSNGLPPSDRNLEATKSATLPRSGTRGTTAPAAAAPTVRFNSTSAWRSLTGGSSSSKPKQDKALANLMAQPVVAPEIAPPMPSLYASPVDVGSDPRTLPPAQVTPVSSVASDSLAYTRRRMDVLLNEIDRELK